MKILFIGLVWPEPSSSAAGWRILHLVKLFSSLGQVYFASAASKSAYSAELHTMGVIEDDILLNDSTFDTYIKKLQPDIVVFDRFMVEEQYGWRVAQHCPDAIRILDTEDLHFVRLARQEAFKKGIETIDYYTSTAKREIASILRSDISLIISEHEMSILIDTFNIPKDKLFYIPFQEEYIGEDVQDLSVKFEDRANYVFIGNFIHEPNFRTVEVLKKEIWPSLRKKNPHAELHVYGAYASEKVLQLNNAKEKFFIMGRADDARKTLAKYRILIAPIPFGAGAKGKFVDAMATGTPSITTSIGAESMQDSSWGGFICDDKKEFIEHCDILYKNEQLWNEKQHLGYGIFNSRFANQQYSKELVNKTLVSLKDLKSIRKRNFIGEILLQNQVNATKYMSLWIEAKNK